MFEHTPYLKLDISSTLLEKNDCPWLQDAVALADENKVRLGIQMHNSSGRPALDKAAESGLPLSFHSAVLGKYMFNFASEDPALSWQMIDEQYKLMQQYNVCRTVFHCFLMTDIPVKAFGHGLSYVECMLEAGRSELRRNENSIFVSDFTHTDEFLMRRERVRGNLQILQKKYGEFHWCVENDFPAFTSGMLRGEDLAYIRHEICFDTGHMWAACKMLGLDFFSELDTALASGRVEMVHLHASRYAMDTPHDQFGDGHLPLTYPGVIDLKKVVQKCRKAGVGHFVLECGDITLDDIKLFLQYNNEVQ